MHSLERGSRLTKFETLTEIQRRTGTFFDDLIPPELPEELHYLWMQFIEIRKGAVAIGYAELDAYQRVTGCTLSPFESEIMLKIDMLRRS